MPRIIAPLVPEVDVIRPLGLHGVGVLKINGVPYSVERLSSADEAGEIRVTGFRMVNCKNGRLYDVGLDGGHWRCDCPDATFRPDRQGGCKHLVALRCKGILENQA